MTSPSIALFEQKEIRKISHHDEWWFSVIDIVSVLAGSEARETYEPTGEPSKAGSKRSEARS